MNTIAQIEADLRRANIRLVWAFCDRMTDAQFLELCRVTVAQIGRDAHIAQDLRDRLECVS